MMLRATGPADVLVAFKQAGGGGVSAKLFTF
jgi:hypothetical protein